MNYCIYEPIHGNYPSNCKECDGCIYNYHEPYGDIIKEWRKEAHVDIPVLYKYSFSKKELIICTSKPGYMIGYQGMLIDKYRKILEQHIPIDTITFIECTNEVC